MISGAANVRPRKRPWLRVIGIASFAIAVRTHGEDGEEGALAAIFVFESRRKDATLRRTLKLVVVLARAKPLTYFCFERNYFLIQFMRDNYKQ